MIGGYNIQGLAPTTKNAGNIYGQMADFQDEVQGLFTFYVQMTVDQVVGAAQRYARSDASGYSASQASRVSGAIDTLSCSPSGNRELYSIFLSGKPLLIDNPASPYDDGWDPQTGHTKIDADPDHPIYVNVGSEGHAVSDLAPIWTIIGHEIGHQLNYGNASGKDPEGFIWSDGFQDNISVNENPLRAWAGLRPRVDHSAQPGPGFVP